MLQSSGINKIVTIHIKHKASLYKSHHERQSTDVGMNHGAINKISKGELHNAAHLLSPGSEEGRVVMGNDPELANTAERISRVS